MWGYVRLWFTTTMLITKDNFSIKTNLKTHIMHVHLGPWWLVQSWGSIADHQMNTALKQLKSCPAIFKDVSEYPPTQPQHPREGSILLASAPMTPTTASDHLLSLLVSNLSCVQLCAVFLTHAPLSLLYSSFLFLWPNPNPFIAGKGPFSFKL